MVDANQKWSVPEAITWMKELAKFKLHWIEEPTSPDDILGHLEISKALKEHGIGVATGEVCQNRVMFKQFLASGGMQFCQIDSGKYLQQFLRQIYFIKHKKDICKSDFKTDSTSIWCEFTIRYFLCVKYQEVVKYLL